MERKFGRNKGKIINVLSGLCFSESFIGSISSPSSLCAGTAFNDWVFSLKSVFLDLGFSHILIITEILLFLSETLALSLAGLAFRFS